MQQNTRNVFAKDKHETSERLIKNKQNTDRTSQGLIGVRILFTQAKQAVKTKKNDDNDDDDADALADALANANA